MGRGCACCKILHLQGYRKTTMDAAAAAVAASHAELRAKRLDVVGSVLLRSLRELIEPSLGHPRVAHGTGTPIFSDSRGNGGIASVSSAKTPLVVSAATGRSAPRARRQAGWAALDEHSW